MRAPMLTHTRARASNPVCSSPNLVCAPSACYCCARLVANFELSLGLLRVQTLLVVVGSQLVLQEFESSTRAARRSPLAVGQTTQRHTFHI